MAVKVDFENYPYLTKDEFYEACHYLDRRYCQASLGPRRRCWKLQICTALDTNFSFDDGYTTYVQITRPLEDLADYGDLSVHFSNLSVSEPQLDRHQVLLDDHDMTNSEDADEV